MNIEMQNNTMVSIIMPCFNAEHSIEKSIQSVQSQSYTNWELLITDDNSTDKSVAIVEALMKNDSRIKLFKLSENGGAASARNHSISHALGRYIAFLDSDDSWYPTKLEKQIAHMRSNELTLCYSGYEQFRGNNLHKKVTPPTSTSYHELLKTCVIGCLTAIYDSSHCGKRFMPEIRKRQDFALWLGILKEGYKAGGIPEPLAKYQLHGGMSQNKWRVLSYQWSVYRDLEKLPLHKSLYYFCHYSVNGLIKHS
jgi:glycosyltransferase involved in cell wall biosynthesis